MVNIREMLVDPSKYSIKCPYSMTATRIVVHNTANDASANNEISYMRSNNNKVSFHAAVDDNEVAIGVPFNRNTWNAGDGDGKGNREGISIEICYSLSGGDRFIQAEKNAAEYIANLLKERGWGIDKVTKHQDYNGKNCPHRTLEMGWERFLNMISSFMGEVTKPANPAPQSTLKSIDEIVAEIKAGKWGNNPQRKEKLIAAGYDYETIQNRINRDFGVPASVASRPTLKSVNEIAQEIINGKGNWGNGTDRRTKLTNAGYDYNAVQSEVNRICGGQTSARKSNAEIAKEVSAGLWGNGQTRKDKLRAAGYDYDAVQKLVK